MFPCNNSVCSFISCSSSPLSLRAAATRCERTSSRCCPSWSNTSRTSVTAACSALTQRATTQENTSVWTPPLAPPARRSCQTCCEHYGRRCGSWACECSACVMGGGLFGTVLWFVLCPQGAGRVDKTAGGQHFGRREERSSAGAGEAAGEDGAQRRANQQTVQTRHTSGF